MVNKPNHLLVQDERAEHLGNEVRGASLPCVFGLATYPNQKEIVETMDAQVFFFFAHPATVAAGWYFTDSGQLAQKINPKLCAICE